MKHDHGTPFAERPAPWRGTIRKVPHIEARRWRNERTLIRTSRRRDWTHDEVDRMVGMLDAGRDLREIARALGRSLNAIKVKSTRLGFSMRRCPTVLNGRQVGRLLGLPCSKKVTDWIARGPVPARARRPAQGRDRTIWAVQYDDLVAFLRDQRYWMSWTPDTITDPDLLAELIALRQGAPRWLSVGEVARRYCVGISAVNQWINKGFLPSTRYGNHWIWSADLEGWVIPCERSRVGISRGVGRRVVGQARLEAA